MLGTCLCARTVLQLAQCSTPCDETGHVTVKTESAGAKYFLSAGFIPGQGGGRISIGGDPHIGVGRVAHAGCHVAAAHAYPVVHRSVIATAIGDDMLDAHIRLFERFVVDADGNIGERRDPLRTQKRHAANVTGWGRRRGISRAPTACLGGGATRPCDTSRRADR